MLEMLFAGLLGISVFLTGMTLVLSTLDVRYLKSARYRIERDSGYTTIYPWLMWLRWTIFAWVVTGIVALIRLLT